MIWTKIGNCDVDSGQIIIIDPCYILPDHRNAKIEHTYDELLANIGIEPTTDKDLPVSSNETEHPIEIFGGVNSPTKDGDGCFPVYALHEHPMDNRPLALMIDFSGSECEGCGEAVSDIEYINKCKTHGQCCRECGDPSCEGDCGD